jgi:hypothetical protein
MVCIVSSVYFTLSQRAKLDAGADTWDEKHGRPKQQAPKSFRFTQDFHAVTGIF